MAEIKIEKKKPIWPWILLVLIIILAIVLYFMFGNRVDDDTEADDVNTEITEEADDREDYVSYEDSLALANSEKAFRTYTTSIQDTTALGTDAVKTKAALINLSRAVEAKANQFGLENSESLEMLNKEIRSVDSTLTSTNQNIDTKMFKGTGMRILAVMDTIQKVKFPQLTTNVDNVKDALNRISPEQQLTNQAQHVNSFFRQSNEVLNKMNKNLNTENYEYK